MTYPTRYEVGDEVYISSEALQNIINGNRSIKHDPGDGYVKKACAIHAAGTIGKVTHTFPPGYEVTARFGDQSLHMKDHWIERAPAQAPLADDGPHP